MKKRNVIGLVLFTSIVILNQCCSDYRLNKEKSNLNIKLPVVTIDSDNMLSSSNNIGKTK